MKCCVIYCDKQARHTYKIKDVKFAYCKRHIKIPDTIMKKVRNGFYGGHKKLLKIGEANKKYIFELRDNYTETMK